MVGIDPIEEQELCISCGFCCDRTIFDVARLQVSDELYDKFVDLETEIEGNRYMKLPCPYFNGKCTIYDKMKPEVCSKFKCTLLRSAISGDRTKNEALAIITEAKTSRDEIVEMYSRIKGNNKSFRDIFADANNNMDEFESNRELKLILMKANLLEILLTKYFKPKDTFNEFYDLID